MSNNLILRSKKPSFEIPLKSVGEVIWKKLQELNSETTCIIDAKSGTKITLKEVISQANSVAIALINRGIAKSDRFCIFSFNTIPYCVLLFASYFLGITLVPISPLLAGYELKKDIVKMESIVIFTSVEKAKYFDEIIEIFNSGKFEKLKIKSVFVLDGSYANYIPFDELLEEGKDQILNRIPYFDVDPKNDMFLLLRSSGTTGLPKITIISHYSFVAALIDYWTTKQFDTLIVSMTLPLGHLGGSLFFPMWFCLGATVILFEKLEEELLLKSVEKYRINLMTIFASMGHKIINGELADKYDLSSVKMMITAGAAFPKHISKDIVNKYNVLFHEFYGMTECMPTTEFPDIEYTEFIPGNVGVVARNLELKIVDINTKESLRPNNDGEIYIRGPQMFSGYLNNIEATKETIDSDGWLHTGDIGHYDQNERIFISDRLKEVIKFGTSAVCPTEIEQFLLTHESVAEVAVVGVKHESENQWPRAYVKLKEGKSATEEELRMCVAESMGFKNQLRAGVVFIDEIPKLGVGKIDRNYFKNLISNEVINK